jgi:trigger factor
MQSELNLLEALKRELKITIPADEVSGAYNKHLNDAAKQAKLPGFRPGKVPMDVIEKKYGAGLKKDVAGELIRNSFDAVLAEKKQQIAGQPQIEPGLIEIGQPFEYVASYEVYPEFELKDLADVKLEKMVAEVSDEDINKMLEKIQHQQADWVDADRAAKEGDRLTMDFEGTLDGELFDGGSSKDFNLELGSKQMIPGFEDALIGVKANEVKDISIPFPEDYPAENLAGKETQFKITVHAIQEPKLPELNDDLAEKAGILGGLDGMKAEVVKGMRRELKQATETRIKMNVLDKLIELNPIDVPETLLDMEISSLQNTTKQQMASQQGKKEIDDIPLPREPYVEQAAKRVTLGLLLGEVIKSYGIKVDGAKVRERIEEMAAAYRQPEDVINWYYNNKEMLSEVESLVVEDQAVEKLLDKAVVSEKPSSYDDVVNSKDQ